MKRGFVLVALGLFFAFEASRAVALGGWLLPIWKAQIGTANMILSRPWWNWLPSLTIVFIAFAVPMAGFVFALRWLHLRLFRNGTLVNSLLTKLNLR